MTDTKDLRDEFAMAALTGICASITAGAGHEVFHGADGGIITADKYAALNAWAVADAMVTERRTVDEPQAEPWEAAHGYQEAFYKIAEILGVGSLPTTPAQAFASVIVPKLRELMAAHGRTV